MRNCTVRFLGDDGGNLTVITALAVAVLTGIAGLAVIYQQGVHQRTVLQAALDSGVLAGTALRFSAKDSERIKAAEAAFYANADVGQMFGGEPEGEFIAEGGVKPAFTVKKTSVSGTASVRIENTLGAALGIAKLDVVVGAKATKRESAPLCLLTLGETAENSIYAYGNARLDANCPIQANSADDEAISVSGTNSEISASMIGVAGGTSGSGIRPAAIRGTEPVGDPYALLPVPEPGSCLMTDAVFKTSQAINPGTYCGGLTVKTGATLTLNPGIYIIKDGQFRTDSGGNIVGEEVLIALIGADSYIYLGSGSNVKLTSPVSGTYKNMQFMSDRDTSASKFDDEWTQIMSGAILEYDGVMYLPEQNFWASGTAHQAIVRSFSPTFGMVVDTAWIQGNAVLEVRQEDRRNIGEVDGRRGFEYSAKLVR
jgi:Flp pilus assembly protein TadG